MIKKAPHASQRTSFPILSASAGRNVDQGVAVPCEGASPRADSYRPVPHTLTHIPVPSISHTLTCPSLVV
jgi:hypothetical protein